MTVACVLSCQAYVCGALHVTLHVMHAAKNLRRSVYARSVLVGLNKIAATALGGA